MVNTRDIGGMGDGVVLHSGDVLHQLADMLGEGTTKFRHIVDQLTLYIIQRKF